MLSCCSLHSSHTGVWLICEPESANLLRTFHGCHSTKSKSSRPPCSPRGPAPYAYHLPALTSSCCPPYSFCSDHMGLPAVLQTCQASQGLCTGWSLCLEHSASHPHVDASSRHSGLRFSFTCSARPSIKLCLFYCLHGTIRSSMGYLHLLPWTARF